MLDLKEFHQILLEILIEFDRICRENKLKYSLAYGTLLGAVRHKGFIPWDDDVDVLMPREDFEKFCHLGKEEISNKFFLQTNETEKEYPYNIARLRKNNTTMIYEKWQRAGFHQGIYIDIYPCDKIPDNKLSKFIQKWLIVFLTPIRIAENKEVFLKCGLNINLKIKKVMYYFLKKFSSPKFKYFEKQIITKYNDRNESNVGIICEGLTLLRKSKDMDPFPSSFLNNYIELEFENQKFICVKQYKELLELWYGNYKKLPPESERKMYHHPKYYDVKIGYENFVNKDI